jgi:hypothetical protein
MRSARPATIGETPKPSALPVSVRPHPPAPPKAPVTGEAQAPPVAPGDAADAAERPSPRRAFIEATAAALGQTWAEDRRRDLHREGRLAAGGWPGTLHEARTLVGHAFVGRMKGRGLAAITEQERTLAVRTAYATARTAWRRCVDHGGS